MPTPPKSKAAAHFFCFIAWQSDTELGWHWPGPQILFQFQWSARSDIHCTSIGCLRDLRQTSETSRQAMFSVSNTLRPSKITVCMNADGAVVRTAMQSAWGSRFKFEHSPSIMLYFANWDILRYTEINQQYCEMIMVYWEINIIDVEIIIISFNTLIYWDIPSSTWYIEVYLGTCVVQLV